MNMYFNGIAKLKRKKYSLNNSTLFCSSSILPSTSAISDTTLLFCDKIKTK